MGRVKTPTEKKRISLVKDRRNVYGECSTSSRKNISRGGHDVVPESVGSEVRAMEEVSICVYSTEHERESAETHQYVRVPGRLRYPSRLLSSTGKNSGKNE
jgi:hypothetical protein